MDSSEKSFVGLLASTGCGPRRNGGGLHRQKPAVTKFIIYCGAILVLVSAGGPARSDDHAANHKRVGLNSAPDDCETRMQKLDASQAEGAERLAQKNLVIDACAGQYKNDKTIGKLVKECAKYVEQPVVKQQFVAECQLAAFNYANILYALKAEYRK